MNISEAYLVSTPFPIIISTLSVVFNLLLGLVVFLNNRKSATNVIFAFLNIFLAFFLASNLLSTQPSDYSEKLMWVRLVMFTAIFLNAFVYLFIRAFPHDELKISKKGGIFVAIVTIITALMTLTPFLITGISVPKTNVPVPIFGSPLSVFGKTINVGIAWFSVFTFCFTLASVWALARKIISEKDPISRIQIKYLLAGVGIMFSAFFLFNLVFVAVFSNTFFINLTPLAVSVFIMLTSYAILKHHLFSVKIIATELLVFSLWTFILIRTILSMTVEDQMMNAGLLFLMVVTGIFLIRSVIKEVDQREKLAESAVALKESHEREMEKARTEAKLRDEFVFVAAHELRTPITAIRGFLELVGDVEVNFPKDVQDDLGAIRMASDHLNELVNNLLEIARSDAGAMKIETSPMLIAPVISEILKELGSLALEKEIKIIFNDSDNCNKILADDKKTKEVFVNLIGNAIKYNKNNGTVNIDIDCIDEKNVVIKVKDTGFGIPKDQQGKIFGKFFRASNKDTQGILGTGLGLFITKMLVEKMGGTIMFSSEEGVGTTFAVSFPRA
ncbi:MAG TPA: ATP-binding protein [Candidatus Paceibacterota bacterium]|nr:ATP-binding protein [Candidatus Paceibacterota bacterium]